ncbi:MAG TPA: hypothetical protein VL197_06390 [Nitrospirota bacterium]|nr:hypothetical protein [Nitrospirota bacterium]
MPVRCCIALIVTVLPVLFLAPGLSRAQSDLLEESAVTVSLNANDNPTPHAAGNDAETGKQENGFWAWLWNSVTDEAHITVGYGILETDLKINRKSDGASATMAQRDTSAIFLSYSTASSFFKDSNFGYSFMVNYVNFDMGEQEISRNEFVNLGTHISGQMIYAVPTLFYQWGEHRYKGKFVRLGVGAGLGAATYSGTVQLSGSQIPGEIVYTANKSYAPRLALSDFLEARWHHFGIVVTYAAPRIYGDTYDIKVSNFSVNIGYTYYF